jgi:predicted metal-dependent hydrolase
MRKKLFEAQSKILTSKEFDDEVKAKEYMAQRLDFFAKKMDLEYSKLKFRRMKRRWGSCSSKSDITLNLYLFNTSKELIDYVIVHELAHLKHMNHSKSFHNLVKKYMPNSSELELKLRAFTLS